MVRMARPTSSCWDRGHPDPMAVRNRWAPNQTRCGHSNVCEARVSLNSLKSIYKNQILQFWDPDGSIFRNLTMVTISTIEAARLKCLYRGLSKIHPLGSIARTRARASLYLWRSLLLSRVSNLSPLVHLSIRLPRKVLRVLMFRLWFIQLLTQQHKYKNR